MDLKEKQNYIQDALKERGMISPQIQAIISAMPEYERNGILSTLIEELLKQQGKKPNNLS